MLYSASWLQFISKSTTKNSIHLSILTRITILILVVILNVFKWIHYLLYRDILISLHFLYLGGYLVSTRYPLTTEIEVRWKSIAMEWWLESGVYFCLFCLLGSSQWTRAYMAFLHNLTQELNSWLPENPLAMYLLDNLMV